MWGIGLGRKAELLTKVRFFVIMLVLVTHTALGADKVKEPAVAGSFYPSDPAILSSMIDEFMAAASVEDIDGEIVALIVPHAGYRYSGSTAAYAFKAIEGKPYETIVLIAPSHHVAFDGISVYDKGSFRTPLGDVAIDEDFASRLIHSHEKIFFYKQAYLKEHSLEVEIPFLQKVLSDFKIVPIIFGQFSYESCQVLGDSLGKLLKDKHNYLIVASTDMSHYHPYEEASIIDAGTITKLKKFDPKLLFDDINTKKSELCGAAPVISAMIAARNLGANEIKILGYANSGDTAGSKSKVVGYLSAVIVKGEKKMLNETQRKKLLQIARSAIETYIMTGDKIDIKESDADLNREMGAFVTIHKDGELRGCIGNILGKGPLYLTVRDMAIQSSAGDPRFTPVNVLELKDIDIEISALSELEKIDDPDIIEMGKHGVLIKSGVKSGVFLPQVATETGWSRDEFLSNLCSHKAGLQPDEWKKGECEIFVFTAEVFGEK